MPLNKIIAIALIACGTLGLVYGGFSFTSDTHDVELGGLSVSVDEREYVNVPIWAGIAGIIVGAGMLVMSRKQGVGHGHAQKNAHVAPCLAQ